MSKEWYESKEWNASATDYEMPTEDTTSTDYEISVPKLECAFATEYYDEDISKTEDTQESTTNKSHKKRMRKMLYGIASMIMVVSMGSAITSTEPIGILSEQKVLFDVYNRETHYAKSGIITVGGAYSIWGGGHISGELRRVNYKGEAIEVEDRNSEGFLGKWINNDGYMLAQRPSRYALYDKNGNFLYEWQDDGFSRIHIAEAAISNNNIVYIYRNVGSVTERKLRFSYYTVYGKELCSIE
ncbi:MAG: hypothetical protein IJ419_10625, partial [Agathobacter sp.]|nr:hypothetical protein [Agathobacter sp.]